MTLLLCVMLAVTSPLSAQGPPRVSQQQPTVVQLSDQRQASTDLNSHAPPSQDTDSRRRSPFRLAQQSTPAPLDPARRSADDTELTPRNPQEAATGDLHKDLFGGKSNSRLLSQRRKSRSSLPSTDVVLGLESHSRMATDAGSLLQKSQGSSGVSNQQRTPIVTDTRIRGQRVGQVLAAGSYWVPARMDLDTMMSKIDARLISNMIVVKGPFSARYGPGFSFVDMQLLPTPRYDGFESHGSTSIDYQTNGEQWYGRQAVFAGNTDWGARVSYGHRTGNDYSTGSSLEMPSSYKSRDLDVAIGFDISPARQVEFNYLRLDQTDVEFPGLVFDINFLTTDAYELKCEDRTPTFADLFTAEGWYNRTRFAGDTQRPSKNTQIPTLKEILFSPDGMSGVAVTDVDGLSAGYRFAVTWGDEDLSQLTIGTDFIYLDTELNDIEILRPPNDNNFPIPQSYSADVGFFAEVVMPFGDFTKITMGTRADVIATNAVDLVKGVPDPISEIKESDLDQDFQLWGSFITAETVLTENWTARAGIGAAERPPTLTELYASGSFIGTLQVGLTYSRGDPQLEPERLYQADLGLQCEYECVRGHVHGYYAWINDFITYDLNIPFDPATTATGVSLTNTESATLAGGEAYIELDLLSNLMAFATMSYVAGRDLGREEAARLGDSPTRSGLEGRDHEPLPGIPPLESRVGVRFSGTERWSIELSTRIVDNQDRVALSLAELPTPGFTTYDIRSYWFVQENLLLIGGVENLTDKFYREHLDFRTGRGVFRPGISFYLGTELTY